MWKDRCRDWNRGLGIRNGKKEEDTPMTDVEKRRGYEKNRSQRCGGKARFTPSSNNG